MNSPINNSTPDDDRRPLASDLASDPNSDPASDREHAQEHAKGHCREAVRDLYLYLDQELSDDQMAAVQVHLHECSPCFEAFDFEAELRVVIATRARDEPPEHLRERLLTMLQSLEPPAV